MIIPAIVALTLNQTDSAMDFAKKFAGGVWEAHFDQMTARLRFNIILDGQVVEGTGLVGRDAAPKSKTPAKPIMVMLTRYGYDPVAKSTYVLDFHNSDTVYQGKARVEGKVFVNDFKAIVGVPGHWVQRTTLTDADTMNSILYTIEDNGEEKEVERFTFKRVKK